MPSPAVEYLKRQLSLDFQEKTKKSIMSAKTPASIRLDMEDSSSTALVFHPSENRAQRSHCMEHHSRGHDRTYSFGRQLSRRLSHRAKQWRESSGCNSTACAISVVFVISILALLVSVANFYLYTSIHGFGPSMAVPQNGGDNEGLSEPRHMDLSTTAAESAHVPVTDLPRPERGCNAYAHVVGNGDLVGSGDNDLDRVILWKRNITEKVDVSKIESNGLLRIKESGFYFVYSQLYFTDSDETVQEEGSAGKLPMYFETLRNGQSMMKSVAPFKEFSTKYHGGIFHLEKGDELEIKVSNNDLRLSFVEEESFFGLYMVRSTSTTHEHR